MRSLRRAMALIVSLGIMTYAAAPRAAERAVRVEAALHRGELAGRLLTWRSKLLLDEGSVAPGEAWVIRLAVPLPPGEALTGPEGVSPIEEGGRVVGFRVEPGAVVDRAVTLTLTQPLGEPRSRVHLGAPLAAGDAVQIVDVGGEEGARFEPDPALGLDREIGYFAPRSLDAAARRDNAARLDYRPRGREQAPLYVRAAGAIARSGGLHGALSTRSERMRGGLIGAGVAFAALATVLAFVRRRLSRAVREQETDALLAAEFERLERRSPP